MAELKPCPFCGRQQVIKWSEPLVNGYKIRIIWSITDQVCGFSMRKPAEYEISENEKLIILVDGKRALIEQWNRRAGEDGN